ncbi:TetR/AcrR family transcriptional regulator [Sutcliffiella rhizosphaerae]|uniref:HTH tetR-type domain-containing protein n=1 Tax=Sutcliffiella rhizosphaerae TaxID=2880967 RepID=A0ABN8A560_9BACI|nr:TetR/AcrR family transcriptional regulator [Sutcliffiella rhizosphaerae]CAG9620248.1 hypothetical protein BACCIP111883_01016 [Sutcliffiella rhizosphaerae]
MSPRKAVTQELTQEMVLKAARDLFHQKGYQQVSMRQIASVLGYSHGAIYYHFKNKADLFYAMIEKDFQLLNDLIRKVSDQNLSDEKKLTELFLTFIKFGLTHKSQYEMMFMMTDKEVKSYVLEGPNETYQVFASFLMQWSSRELNIQEIWSVFLSLHGFVSHYCRREETYDQVETLANEHVNFILKALG